MEARDALKPCPFCGNRGAHEKNCYINLFFESEVLGADIPWEVMAKAWNQRAERTCKVVRRDRDEYGEFAEYSCGHANVWQSWSEPSYCCWCGAKVVE